jgi:hypothetical protein
VLADVSGIHGTCCLHLSGLNCVGWASFCVRAGLCCKTVAGVGAMSRPVGSVVVQVSKQAALLSKERPLAAGVAKCSAGITLLKLTCCGTSIVEIAEITFP